MFGSVLAAWPTFLGPAIAIWITLIVATMAFYFLSGAREYRTRGVERLPEWRQSTSVEPPWVPQSDAVPPYDMENFPDQKWGSPG